MPSKIYPFKFLDAYTKSDQSIFFGREEEIDKLFTACNNSNIVLLYGASGVGKTSLVQCGLSKRLSRHSWVDIYIRRGQNINDSLQEVLSRYESHAEEDLLSEEQRSPLEQQIHNIYLEYFRPIYLIFDQFEELFVLGTAEEQEQFYVTVAALLAMKQEIKLIFSVREEYLAALYPFEQRVAALMHNRIRVEPMSLSKIALVLKGINALPNSLVSIKQGEEEALAELLCQQFQSKGNRLPLPYFQVILDKLYRQIGEEEAVLSVAAAKQLPKMDDIMRAFLEERIAVISKGKEEEQERLWTLLLGMVSLEGTKIPMTQESLATKVNMHSHYVQQQLEALVSNRILRYREEEEVYELAHDSLALSVAEKRSAEEVELLELRRYIESQLGQDGSIGELISEKMLQRIVPLESKLMLSGAEEALVRDSETALVVKKRRKRVVRNGVIGTTLLLMVILSSLTVWALDASREAEASAKVAKNKEAEAMKAKDEALKSQQQAEVSQEVAEKKSEEALLAKQSAEESAKMAKQKSVEALDAKHRAEVSAVLARDKSVEAKNALLALAASDSLRIEEERLLRIAKYNNYVDRIKKELEVQLQVENYSYILAREYMTLAKELCNKDQTLDQRKFKELEIGLSRGESSERIRKNVLDALNNLDWYEVKKLFSKYKQLRLEIGGKLFEKEMQLEEEAKVLCEIMDNMVIVEGGAFEMGCTSEKWDCDKKNTPPHEVHLSTYAISKYECTQEQWRVLMRDNAKPSYFKACGDNCPVESVSWIDVKEYIRVLNKKTGKKFRLPTEAEWEYAARGGKKSIGYGYSGGYGPDAVAWYSRNSNQQTNKVGQKVANELGLYDMSGNVSEWCQDWYDEEYYKEGPTHNPPGPSSGSRLVIRGGTYKSWSKFCLVSYRGNAYPSEKGIIGFRLVLEVTE